MEWEASSRGPGTPAFPCCDGEKGPSCEGGWGALGTLLPASAPPPPCFAQGGDPRGEGGFGAGQGLAPAQQLQPASTKKEKSGELTAAPRNACASVHGSVCAGGQLGSVGLSPPLHRLLLQGVGIPSQPQHPLRRGPSAPVQPSPSHSVVLGQGMLCLSLALRVPEGCRRTGGAWPPSQRLFLAGGQTPSLHDSVRLGPAKYTASSERCAPPGWGHALGQCWPPPGLVQGGDVAPSVLYPMLVGSGWVVLAQKKAFPGTPPSCSCLGVTGWKICCHLSGRAGQCRMVRGARQARCLGEDDIIGTGGPWGAAVPGDPPPIGPWGVPCLGCMGCSAPTSWAGVGVGCRLVSGGGCGDTWCSVSSASPPRCGTDSQGRSWC